MWGQYFNSNLIELEKKPDGLLHCLLLFFLNNNFTIWVIIDSLFLALIVQLNITIDL